MTITPQGLSDLESDINDILEQDRAEIRFTFHAAYDRLNDPRNNPPISLTELDNVFREFIHIHLAAVLSFDEGTTFTLRCNKTNLNFPSAISHDVRYGKIWVIQSVVTVMRKQGFVSKDAIVLEIN